MEHSELVAEMTQVEHLSTQDRLHLARLRRTHQLKVAKQKEKEWLKQQNRRDRNSNNIPKKRRHIQFENSVVLLEAAARNDIDEVARLLDTGISPDATNEDGLTPLHQCCIDNNTEMLRLLLDFGAYVNATDSEKWTPLHAAATCGHLYLVKILISRGANLLAVNVDGNMPYDLCDDEECLDYIEAEMSRRGVTQELIDETRAATENQMLRDLMDLVARGDDLELPDRQGATSLHIAAANGYTKVVEFLLENHAHVDAMDKDLWTPVHAAACWGHMEVLEMLALSGADLNAKNKNDESPSDICEDSEIRERIEQLKSEQESKRLAEAQRRRVRRSQSNNTRAQSVRRTSLRDKTLTTKKDAQEEARLRLQAQEGFTVPDGATEPNSMASDLSTTTTTATNATTTAATTTGNNKIKHQTHQSLNGINHNLNNNNNSNLNNNNNTNTNTNNNHNHHHPHQNHRSYSSGGGVGGVNDGKVQNPLYGNGQSGSGSSKIATTIVSSYPINPYNDTTIALTRRSPDGKDNDAFHVEDKRMLGGTVTGIGLGATATAAGMAGAAPAAAPTSATNNNTQKMGNDISTEIFSASNDNGKINVQVTVLVDHSLSNIDHSLSGTTLSNLKRQRAQSRTGGPPENGSIHTTSSKLNSTYPATLPLDISLASSGISGGASITDVQPTSITKFSGVTSDVVSDSTRSRRCCVLM